MITFVATSFVLGSGNAVHLKINTNDYINVYYFAFIDSNSYDTCLGNIEPWINNKLNASVNYSFQKKEDTKLCTIVFLVNKKIIQIYTQSKHISFLLKFFAFVH